MFAGKKRWRKPQHMRYRSDEDVAYIMHRRKKMHVDDDDLLIAITFVVLETYFESEACGIDKDTSNN